MRIVVIGGTGLIGSRVVSLLTEHGHEAVPASPNSGVNTVTGEGVKEVLQGADVVVDVSNSPSFADDDVMAFFRAATTNLTEAAKGAGVGHFVALSVIGSDRLPESGYLRAKVAQEELIKDSGLPYSIVRATQFFEFVGAIADGGTEGNVVKLPDAGIQPIAASEVSGAVAKVAAGSPLNGMTEIGGPEVFTMESWVREALTFRNDPREVTVDPEARYFGEKPGPKGLLPDAGAQLGQIKFADWLPANPPRK
ncbi:SDR family oxidoreductase [Amycolatopsis sp. NPDC050768]|uniref:SDR family oxidoreductase n=1 Tax=Amycolatopsis sp. NPDC050768 TaxID=3154839 RepID=UPI0033FA291F